MSTFLSYPDRDALMQGLAKIVAKQLDAVLADKGRATLAVPGGTTPEPFLDALSLKKLDWAGVTVLLTDERLQPADPSRSNFRLVQQHLDRNEAGAAHFLPMAAIDQASEAATHAYNSHLPIDVLVLGMGADMHTASLFPDAEELDAALLPDAPPLVVINSPSQPEARLTLTAPVLSGAGHVHVLITGPEKLAAYIDAEEGAGSVSEAPIRCVLHRGKPTMVHHNLG